MEELDDQSPETIEYKAITGTFGEVRYFLTTLDHSDAAENIRFAGELQGKWGFSERVQRKLDEKRAETELFAYLAKNGIRFFNSLVIVLLPNSDEQTEFWDFSQVMSKGKPLEKWVNLKLYKGVSRIVIDGQHRLLSLKKYWNIHIGKQHLSPQEEAENCACNEPFDIPVVYLVFGNLGRVGYSEETVSIRDEAIKATRNIFTVINNTAKRIDRQTQLLLDDTKLSALIPRKLLEEDVLEDKIVKWSSKSTNLTQLDPYLTTIDLISKCAVEIVIDYKKTALKKILNSPLERENAMKIYYESHPKIPHIGTRSIFKWFFYELQPFQDWLNQLEHLGISVPAQPEEIKLQGSQKERSQKEQLKKLRESNILYTVLGQRVVFFAISRFLLRIKVEYRIPEILDAIAKSIAKMHEKGFFNRNAPHWKNVIVQPNEKLTMITTGSGSDKCIELLRMIFLNTSDGVRELIKSTREDVDSEANWTIDTIATWRKEFFVELPEVKSIEDDTRYEEDHFAKATEVNDENISSVDTTNFRGGDDEDDEEIFDEIEDEMEDESEIDE
ncbi:MAG: DNA sulfur modification protein DndB [Brasilonema angustatum HA4187-MV1]|nr:DNA sulfur modification protein DndB [Brasilonema angustatum HA4187-MV1]